jgi:hypothetical protein
VARNTIAGLAPDFVSSVVGIVDFNLSFRSHTGVVTAFTTTIIMVDTVDLMAPIANFK